MSLRIYVASSWRNTYYPSVIGLLKSLRLLHYDFRNPHPGNHGFHWGQIEEDWREWETKEYVEALKHPLAKNGFETDKKALDWANFGILILPSGKSAHLEAGYLIGRGFPVIIYIPEKQEPELMYLLGSKVVGSLKELEEALRMHYSVSEWGSTIIRKELFT